jgi:hypothetical protein
MLSLYFSLLKAAVIIGNFATQFANGKGTVES